MGARAMVAYPGGAGARGDTGITAVPPDLERSRGEEKIPREKPGRRENLPSAPSWGLFLTKSSQKLTGKGSRAMQLVGQHQDTERSREEVNACEGKQARPGPELLKCSLQ